MTDRYDRLIEMQNEVINEYNSLEPGLVREELRKAMVTIEQKVDRVFEYMLAEFYRPDEVNDPAFEPIVKASFVPGVTVDTTDRTILESLEDRMIPIAVGRYMLGEKKIKIKTTDLNHFSDYAQAYKGVLL